MLDAVHYTLPEMRNDLLYKSFRKLAVFLPSGLVYQYDDKKSHAVCSTVSNPHVKCKIDIVQHN
jgi:hypothetical protein